MSFKMDVTGSLVIVNQWVGECCVFGSVIIFFVRLLSANV